MKRQRTYLLVSKNQELLIASRGVPRDDYSVILHLDNIEFQAMVLSLKVSYSSSIFSFFVLNKRKADFVFMLGFCGSSIFYDVEDFFRSIREKQNER